MSPTRYNPSPPAPSRSGEGEEQLLVPKLCLGTSGPEALLRRNDEQAERDASLQGTASKQSFEAVRSQAELGNEGRLPLSVSGRGPGGGVGTVGQRVPGKGSGTTSARRRSPPTSTST